MDTPQLLAHVCFWIGFAAFWRWPALWPLMAVLSFWNYAVLHNHMHAPIVPRWARGFVSRTLGFACGFPYSAYRQHHANHHHYDNGAGDWGQPLPGERGYAYVARWLAYTWLTPWKPLARMKGVAADCMLFYGSAAVLVATGHATMLLAWITAHAGVYYLNIAAHEGDYAVTSRSRFYNTVLFGAGYHTAHHRWPHKPWRQLAEQALYIEVETPLSPLHPVWVYRTLHAPAPEHHRVST